MTLIERVVEEIKKDLENGDVTALEELLSFTPKENLIAYLPEEEWERFENEYCCNNCGGGLKEIDDTNYEQYVVRYEYFNGKIGERYFDNYSDAIKSYDESVDNEKDGGSSTIYLEGYTGEDDGYVLMRYFDPREIKDEDEYADGGGFIREEMDFDVED